MRKNTSLYPEGMIWSRTIPPSARSLESANDEQWGFSHRFAGTFLTAANLYIYNFMLNELFGLLGWIIFSILVNTGFLGYLHQMWAKPNRFIYSYSLISTAFVLGTMFYQIFFSH